MSRYIDAELLPDLFDKEYKYTCELIKNGESHLDNLAEGFTEAHMVVAKVHTADVAEVKHGEWLENGANYKCSICGNTESYYTDSYCRVCGAKMDL